MKTKIRLKKKILKNVGLRLKNFRTLRGISQENLAFQVGLDRTYIGAIEQGLRSPSLYCLFIIANALDVAIKDLVDIDID
ncbi:helix-turn-helix transcriptional regulator [bacterium]|nr:helix-turn-helix transcriptional regulator [bacterium]